MEEEFWRAKMEEDVGGIEGLWRWMITGMGWCGPGIGNGQTGGKLDRENAGKIE